VDFSDDILGRVQAVQNGQARLRVFLNRTLVVERKSGTDAGNTQVNGGVNTVTQEHQLKETIKRGVLGKIVAVNDANISVDNYWHQGTCDGFHIRTVYVTFDPGCNDQACAWAFTRLHDMRQDSPQYDDGTYKVSCLLNSVSDNGLYYLAAVPQNSQYTSVELFSKKGLMKRHMNAPEINDGGVYETNTLKYSIRLQLDLTQLLEIVKQSIDHPGVGNPGPQG